MANRVDKALGYTLEAHIYGETGWIANRLYEGALAVGIDLPTDSEFMEALSFIRFRNTQQKRPVVLIYTDIPTEALLQENGCNLKDYGNGLKPKIGKDKQYRLKQGIKIPESQIFYVCKENFQALTEAYREFVNSQNNLA